MTPEVTIALRRLNGHVMFAERTGEVIATVSVADIKLVLGFLIEIALAVETVATNAKFPGEG